MKKLLLMLAILLWLGIGFTAAQTTLKATGGTGAFREDINWLNFADVTDLAAGGSINKSFAVGNVSVSVILDQVSFSGGSATPLANIRLVGYKSGSWRGDGLDDLYNIGGTSTNNTLTNGLSTSAGGNSGINPLVATFRLRAYATLNGQPIDLGLVFASAEDDTNGEYTKGSTNGSPWKLFESVIPAGNNDGFNKIIFSNSNTTAQLQMGSLRTPATGSSPANVALLYTALQNTSATNQLTSDLQFAGTGRSAMAIGIIIKEDFGDAPVSYGSAGNVFFPVITGGNNNPPTNGGGYYLRTGVNGASVADSVITNGTVTNPQNLRLGALGGDNDLNYPAAGNGTFDNTDDQNDEDAFAAAPDVADVNAPTYTLNIPAFKNFQSANTPAYIMAWYDFNKNGTFEPAEYTTSSFTANNTTTAVPLTWTLGSIPKNAGATYARFRITTTDPATLTDNTATAADERSAVTLANGETEDYFVTLKVPAIIAGTIFIDNDRGTIDGAPYTAGNLNAVLIDAATGLVVGSTPINTANGQYSFSDIPNGNYTLILSTTPGTIGQAPPAVSLPPGYGSSAEGTTPAGDGSPDATLSLTITNATPIPNASFAMFDRALPVIFDNVAATITGNELQVNWKTLSEINNDHFEIEVSKDGYNFTKIGEVKSKATDGNSDKSISYNFSKTAASLFGISLLLLGCFIPKNRRKTYLILALIGIMGYAISCNKKTTDAIEGNGKVFVRVLQVDKDGTKNYSKVVVAIRE